ncbi:hypothetical protein EB796_019670 [Bugula neritina]|uniref:Uncharacterized protein n=1 Tax=Bugula neritina TaxID=10212 RepID=A0A7J7J7E1_BUGNE|nr:hypothetical protein EB796_019670 [Bugula neritina]
MEIITELEKDLLSHESKAALKATLAESGRLATEVFVTEGHQHKYGRSEIWSKYMELFTRERTERENNLIINYEHAKQVDDLKKANEAIKLKMEKEVKANAEKFGQLKSEAKMTKERLEEVKKSSEKREKASQEMLDKITEQMKTAREEDRAYYEQERERYRESIRAEQEARDNAEKMNAEKLSDLNATIQNLNSMMEKQRNLHQEQINELEEKLEEEGMWSSFLTTPNDCKIL